MTEKLMEEMRIKPIKDHPDYWVSNTGRVFSMKFNKCKELKQCDEDWRSGPRLSVQLCTTGKRYTISVHFLVIQAYGSPKPDNTYLIRHLDSNYKKNYITNLAWGTDLENRHDRIDHEKELEDDNWI